LDSLDLSDDLEDAQWQADEGPRTPTMKTLLKGQYLTTQKYELAWLMKNYSPEQLKQARMNELLNFIEGAGLQFEEKRIPAKAVNTLVSLTSCKIPSSYVASRDSSSSNSAEIVVLIAAVFLIFRGIK
jgi:hypothetical protein